MTDCTTHNSKMATKQDSLEAADLAEVGGVTSHSSEDWKKALDQVVPCVVVLKITQTRAFDTEPASSSYATGFIVDKHRGIILTNRHVVTPGPIVAEAIFLNREELPVYPLWYDPVHDFAFLRFDPSKLTFMEVGEVPLAPEAASVGLDIRVVGNDSGEKVSILAGVLARLDRDAPVYGRKGYNDFNTFYLQAASGTKGGSSGSPVINVHGKAVGLNAGGKNKAASAYYLPLDSIVRALKLIQASKPLSSPWPEWTAPNIPRGDLQSTFVFKGFDEVRRLGLREDTEREVRKCKQRSHGTVEDDATTGMLVVENVCPGSPADGVISPGDVLVRINGKFVVDFIDLEEICNNNVGQNVSIVLERGGLQIDAVLEVTDLHKVTPSSFLEIAGGAVHALSYQQARNNRAVVGQVYVAEPGYMLGRASVPKHAIITALKGKPTPTVEAFATILGALPHGARVPLEYFTFTERHRRKNAILHVDRQWYGTPVYWVRDDAAGLWHPTTDWPLGAAAPPAEPAKQLPAAAAANGVSDMEEEEGAEAKTDSQQLEERLRDCLALVDVDIPLVALSDGVHARSFAGNGVVVFHGETLGLVLMDRNTVTVGPCDVNLSFGAHPAEVPAHVRFLHPMHNFAIVSYDPQALPAEARRKIKAAELVTGPALKRGDSVHLAGLTKFLRIMLRKSTITNAMSSITIPAAEVPRFRAVHEEVIKLDHDFGATFSGVLTDDKGRVRALWGSYAEQIDKDEREWCAGLPTEVFYPWVQRLIALEQNPGLPVPSVRVLDAELEPVLLSKAAQFNLPPEWISRLDKLDPERRQVLRVRSCVANSHAALVLKSGDMLLAMAGKPVTCYRDVERLIASYPAMPLPAAAAVGSPPACSSPRGTSHLDDTPNKRRRTNTGCISPISFAAQAQATSIAGNAIATPTANGHCEEGGNGSSPIMMPLTIFRAGEIMEVQVKLATEDGLGTNRLVHWCGAQLQAPHRAVRELGFLPEASGVYISRWHHGSPAHRYGLYALHFVSEVNGVPTPDIDTFLEVIKSLKDGDFVRVVLCHLETTQPKVLTLKVDLKYWPTWELRLDPTTSKWQRVEISTPLHQLTSRL